MQLYFVRKKRGFIQGCYFMRRTQPIWEEIFLLRVLMDKHMRLVVIIKGGCKK